ncbi:sensor histidine kinase [Flavisphingomonas formosensis]|uniref:sensor histidine kinase n=1 Tax=Flavisphingomonas formosensis TaxID=861534 RepID=UPI0012FA765D|nr:HAMP domain-containing sensor histidine kinase [Sphingomonas formosensis]
MLSDRLRLRDIRSTSTFRLTVLFGVIFTIGVAALLGLIYGLTAHELNARSDRILRLKAAQLSEIPPAMLVQRLRTELDYNTSALNYLALRDRSGRIVIGNIEPPSDLRLDKPVDIAPRPGLPRPLRLLAIRTDSGETLYIGRDITPFADLRQRVLAILIVSGLSIAALVFASAIALSVAPLRRVRDLQSACREIGAGNLDMRMPILGRGDELDLLAETVNTTVEEVGRVVAQVKQATDAIAHDLRTPLTHLRNRLDRVRHDGRLPADLASAVDLASADLEEVLGRFAALLRISEFEAGRRQEAFGPVQLGPLLHGICDLYEPLAEDGSIMLSLDIGMDVTVHGDEKLIFEALSNLVDNALKFTPPGGIVGVTLIRDETGNRIEVRDSGPGIAADERNAVLRRFHRAADAAEIPGLGLGLSVVAAIMHLHGFGLELDDAHPGLLVRIRCPIRQDTGQHVPTNDDRQ